MTRFDDAEDRARRCCLVFVELEDMKGENWGESEKKIIDIYSKHFKEPIEAKDIERAYRLVSFSPNKGDLF